MLALRSAVLDDLHSTANGLDSCAIQLHYENSFVGILRHYPEALHANDTTPIAIDEMASGNLFICIRGLTQYVVRTTCGTDGTILFSTMAMWSVERRHVVRTNLAEKECKHYSI